MTDKKIKFVLNESDDISTIRVLEGGELYTATKGEHEAYDTIVATALRGESVKDLFDIGKTLNTKFQALTNRIAVKNGLVYVDDEPLGDVISEVVLGAMDRNEEFDYLVKFCEDISRNPGETSADSLYTWLKGKNVTWLPDGRFIGYKSVDEITNDGDEPRYQHTWQSISSGQGTVDGVDYNGQLPQSAGSIVSMPREIVDSNPNVSCSVGLHIADWSYGSTFGHGTTLAIAVSAEDVAAVPTDANARKMRAVRYQCIGPVTAEFPAGVLDEDFNTLKERLNATV